MLYLLSVGCKEQKHGAKRSRFGCALATPSVYLSFDFPIGLMPATTFRLTLYPFCPRRESERGDFERPGPGSKRVMDNFQESPVRLSVGDNQSRTKHDRCHEPRQLGSVLTDKLGSVLTEKFPSASTEARDASALSSAVDLHQEPTPVAATKTASNETPSITMQTPDNVIGETLVVQGRVEFQNLLRIDGHFEVSALLRIALFVAVFGRFVGDNT